MACSTVPNAPLDVDLASDDALEAFDASAATANCDPQSPDDVLVTHRLTWLLFLRHRTSLTFSFPSNCASGHYVH